jgi:molybdopterin molybdotransferase
MERDWMQQNSRQPITSAPISFAEAVSIVAAHSEAILSAQTTESQECALSEAAGRVLGTALVADRDQPPFDRVTRDGFAVRAQDVVGGAPLRIVGQLRAGEPWPASGKALLPGEALEIMTGAALPPGADAVLMVEHGVEDADGRSVRPLSGRRLTAGENVVSRGSEARRGDALLETGTRLRAEGIALSAACGLRLVQVRPAPRVAILATGDELREVGDAGAGIEPHSIYDSNSHALAALVRQAHAIPMRQRAAPDRKRELSEAIRQALKAAPMLLLSGGVSMGRYDLVEEVLGSLGAEFFFTSVKMQPGKPVVFGRLPASGSLSPRYFFGLPGNPVSTMVTFRVFVQPLLAALSGERNWQPQIALAMLSTRVQGKPGLTRFLPAHLDTRNSEPTVTPLSTQGSGDQAANARANCYIIVPENCELLPAGHPVRVLLR